LALITLVFVLSPCLGDDAASKPITPAEAAKLIDKKVTVEMAVKSTGKSRGVFFLNSEEDYRSASNFTVFSNATGAKKYREAKIDDPAVHLKGKTDWPEQFRQVKWLGLHGGVSGKAFGIASQRHERFP
jgi:hypothetical protein